MSLPKRTPEEWLTVVRVGRPNRTVFTEGSSDARVLRVASGFPTNVDFRTADEVEFEPPADAFVGSNKARVLAVARAYDALHDGVELKDIVLNHARCLVDRDFDVLPDPPQMAEAGGILIVSQYSNLLSCIVTYGWFRGAMLSAFAWDPQPETWDVLEYALTFAFRCRAKNAEDDLGCAAPDVGNYFSKDDESLTFRTEAYLQAYLGLQGEPATQFVSEIETWLEGCTDPRLAVNSNDLFSALFGLVKLHKQMGAKFQEANVREVVLATAPPLIHTDLNVTSLVGWAS